jgi:selenide, water dikinase
MATSRTRASASNPRTRNAPKPAPGPGTTSTARGKTAEARGVNLKARATKAKARGAKSKPAASPGGKRAKSAAKIPAASRQKRVVVPRIRLTAEVTSGGCACKLGPADLRSVLSRLPPLGHPNVLVGSETCDDAGVYRLSATLAMVTTVDFFPPMVDDPYVFGQVAAANALSDVYAMGGKPLVALGIVGFPTGKLPLEVLVRITEGASERTKAAGAVIIGGHSLVDSEIKYGLAVTGTVHPKRIVRNSGAKAGDLLVLTKSLGTGIICTGIKKRVATAEEEGFAIASMTALNDIAGSLLTKYGAHACTDVTGFSLAGHATEMAEASGNVRFEIDFAQLPLLPGTARLADDGYLTGGSARNRQWLGARLHIGRDVPTAVGEAVVDPQTSGGLLVSLPPGKAEAYEEALHRKGLRPAIIGKVVARPAKSPVVVSVS